MSGRTGEKRRWETSFNARKVNETEAKMTLRRRRQRWNCDKLQKNNDPIGNASSFQFRFSWVFEWKCYVVLRSLALLLTFHFGKLWFRLQPVCTCMHACVVFELTQHQQSEWQSNLIFMFTSWESVHIISTKLHKLAQMCDAAALFAMNGVHNLSSSATWIINKINTWCAFNKEPFIVHSTFPLGFRSMSVKHNSNISNADGLNVHLHVTDQLCSSRLLAKIDPIHTHTHTEEVRTTPTLRAMLTICVCVDTIQLARSYVYQTY